MKYFLDTEFIEDGKTIDLLSIGIVAEDGREFYAQSLECDRTKANEFVRENVIPQLWPVAVDLRAMGPDGIPYVPPSWMGTTIWLSRNEMKACVLKFINEKPISEKIGFWGYYADYDWVALCQLFGAMVDLPHGWPMYCHDIKQLCDDLGNPKLPAEGKNEHHALYDARWNKQAYEFLQEGTTSQSRIISDLLKAARQIP